MQAVTKSDLRKEINDILTEADLSKISAIKVRKLLEKRFKVELNTFHTEIDQMIMAAVAAKLKDDSDESEVEDEKEISIDELKGKPEEKDKTSKKRPPTKESAKKSSDSSDGSDSDSSSSELESEPRTKRRKKAAPAVKKPRAKGKGNGFTRPYTLSPELAKLMGTESAPRHEVVKKVWQIIKERNLYDPKNKQFAICDKDLLTVMGVKRFRTFGMLKYLRNHFLD